MYGGKYERHESLSNKKIHQAIAAITEAFMLEHSKTRSKLRIDYLGGEPMLAFDRVQEIDALLHADQDKTIESFLVTNGTVFNDEQIDWLILNDFNIQVSLDLDQQNHDKNRNFKKNNLGSYNCICQNLEMFFERDSLYFDRRISAKAVLDPADTLVQQQEVELHPLFSRLRDLNKFNMVVLEPVFDIDQDHTYFSALEHLREILSCKNNVSDISELVSDLTIRQRAFFFSQIDTFFSSPAGNKLINGEEIILPFAKKCGMNTPAIDINGDISICIKAKQFIIGNTHKNEISQDKINQFINMRYSKMQQCTNCISQKMCPLCYQALDVIDDKIKMNKFCEFTRKSHRKIFELGIEICENNPILWNKLESSYNEQVDLYLTQKS